MLQSKFILTVGGGLYHQWVEGDGIICTLGGCEVYSGKGNDSHAEHEVQHHSKGMMILLDEWHKHKRANISTVPDKKNGIRMFRTPLRNVPSLPLMLHRMATCLVHRSITSSPRLRSWRKNSVKRSAMWDSVARARAASVSHWDTHLYTVNLHLLQTYMIWPSSGFFILFSYNHLNHWMTLIYNQLSFSNIFSSNLWMAE